MNGEVKYLQVNEVLITIYPDPNSNYGGVICESDTNIATNDALFEEILRKYSGAWKQLAEM